MVNFNNQKFESALISSPLVKNTQKKKRKKSIFKEFKEYYGLPSLLLVVMQLTLEQMSDVS